MDVPKPQVPEASSVQSVIEDVIDYLTTRSSTWWTLVAVAVIATIVMVVWRNPLIRGAVIAAVILFCVALSAGMFK